MEEGDRRERTREMMAAREGLDLLLLVLTLEEEDCELGMQVTSGSWKKQGNRFSPRTFRKNAVLLAS